MSDDGYISALDHEDIEWGIDCYTGQPTTDEQKQWKKYWIENRNELRPQLNSDQEAFLCDHMRDLYGDTFFYNRGSWGTEAEAAWQIFTGYADRNDTPKGINLVTIWRNSSSSVKK